MIKKLQKHIANIGLFACVPAMGSEEVAQAVDALVAGGIQGVLISWNKHAIAAVEQVHKRHPQLLIGGQGPYAQASQLFASGASFATDTAGVPDKIQVPFFLRKGCDLLEGTNVLAQCSNKLVFVNDIKQQQWATITRRTEHTVREMLGFELRHIGINHPNAAEAEKTADTFERLFGFPKSDKGGAFFSGPYVESMKKMFYGTHGHIAISTSNAARAAWYLEKRGAQFNWDSAEYNSNGTLRVVYLKDEVGGFAIHLVQK